MPLGKYRIAIIRFSPTNLKFATCSDDKSLIVHDLLKEEVDWQESSLHY